MKKIQNIFYYSQEYELETQQYKKIDLILCLLLYVSVLFLYYLMGKIFVSDDVTLTEGVIFIGTGIISIIIIGIVFAFCSLRRQKISTIGFHSSKAKDSFKCGMILVLSVIMIFGLVAVFSGSSIKSDIPTIFIRFFYYLIEIAFVEELVFRGYIGTRIYGCIKNKFFAVAFTGLLFVFIHLPFQMVMANMTILEYVSYAWANLIFIFLLHFFLQLLYAKYKSIIAPTLFHFAWDYVQWFII